MVPLRKHAPVRRPLVSLDIESTGTDPKTDRIVELAVVLVDTDGSRQQHVWLCNPGIPIPASSTAIHGFDDDAVRDAQPFAAIADEVASWLGGTDFAGFNLRAFDLPLLRAEYARCGKPYPFESAKVVDALHIFRSFEPRTLSAAVLHYLGREHKGAHGALADASAVLDVLAVQMARHDLPADMTELDRLSGGRQPGWVTDCGRVREEDGVQKLYLGKHQGVPLARVDRAYLDWVLRSDFPDDLKAAVRAAGKAAA